MQSVLIILVLYMQSLFTALYAKCPYYFSALYAKFPYDLLLYMQNVLIRYEGGGAGPHETSCAPTFPTRLRRLDWPVGARPTRVAGPPVLELLLVFP